jgi:hypothetical protein
MPVIWCRNHEDVDRFVIEERAIVVDQLGRAAGPLLHLRAPLLADGLIDVADVGDLAIGLIREAAHNGVATAADADTGDAHLVVGRDSPSAE